MYWRVQPYEATATNYWEFIFAKHNVEYAATRKCLPADIPEDWKAITEEVALLSLTKVFNPPTNNSNLATETSRKTMG